MNVLVIPPHDWLAHPVSDRMYEIYERLALRHKVHVLRLKTPYKGEAARPTRCTVIEATQLPVRDLALSHVASLPLQLRELLLQIRRAQIDVVVGGSITTNLLGGLVARVHGIPYVFDCIEYYPRVAAAYYASAIAKHLVGFTAEMATRINCMIADLVLCVSPYQKPYVMSLGAGRTAYIPNGVDVKMFNVSAQKKTKEFVVGFVGTPEAWVDVDFMIEFVKNLSASVDVKFVLVGASLKTDLDSRLMTEMRKSNIKCEQTGFVPHKRVPEYIAEMDLCLLPYRLGNVNYLSSVKLFEYLASGKPVLSKPYPDALRIAKDAVLFFNNMEEALALTMDLIQGRIRHSTELARSIAERYDWDNVSRHVESVLKDLINGRMESMDYAY